MPDAQCSIEDGKHRLQSPSDLWDRHATSPRPITKPSAALRPLRILMRAHWEKAVRGLDTPVASPYAVSSTRCRSTGQFMDQVAQDRPSAPIICRAAISS